MACRLAAAWLLITAPLAQADCVERASARFGLDADLVRAVAEQESFNRVDAVGPLLPDGNRALGKMGINTVHLPELAIYGVTRGDLLTECGSVFVGAWILARYIRQADSIWQAVGFYNTGPKSANRDAQARYIAAVRRRYQRIRTQKDEQRRDQPAPEVSSTIGGMKIWSAQ